MWSLRIFYPFSLHLDNVDGMAEAHWRTVMANNTPNMTAVFTEANAHATALLLLTTFYRRAEGQATVEHLISPKCPVSFFDIRLPLPHLSVSFSPLSLTAPRYFSGSVPADVWLVPACTSKEMDIAQRPVKCKLFDGCACECAREDTGGVCVFSPHFPAIPLTYAFIVDGNVVIRV